MYKIRTQNATTSNIYSLKRRNSIQRKVSRDLSQRGSLESRRKSTPFFDLRSTCVSFDDPLALTLVELQFVRKSTQVFHRQVWSWFLSGLYTLSGEPQAGHPRWEKALGTRMQAGDFAKLRDASLALQVSSWFFPFAYSRNSKGRATDESLVYTTNFTLASWWNCPCVSRKVRTVTKDQRWRPPWHMRRTVLRNFLWQFSWQPVCWSASFSTRKLLYIPAAHLSK